VLSADLDISPGPTAVTLRARIVYDRPIHKLWYRSVCEEEEGKEEELGTRPPHLKALPSTNNDVFAELKVRCCRGDWTSSMISTSKRTTGAQVFSASTCTCRCSLS
jgi:hypothetical protein